MRTLAKTQLVGGTVLAIAISAGSSFAYADGRDDDRRGSSEHGQSSKSKDSESKESGSKTSVLSISGGGAPEINMAGLVTAVGLLGCLLLTMDRKYRLQ